MKAEERKHLERNELASRLNTAWQGMTSNSTAVTVVWGVILLGLVGLIGYRYYARFGAETRSELWSRLDRADTAELEKIIAEHKNTNAARIARYHLSRFQLQDGLNRIASPNNSTDRAKAAEDVEKARDRYAELAKEREPDPLLNQEAMMGVAKARKRWRASPRRITRTPPREAHSKRHWKRTTRWRRNTRNRSSERTRPNALPKSGTTSMNSRPSTSR